MGSTDKSFSTTEPKGRMGHKSCCAKVAREEKAKLKEGEMEVDADAQRREIAEIKSPKRKVNRESEETTDYVCGTLAISQEEAEEMGFVRSAHSEPRGPVYFCDD